MGFLSSKGTRDGKVRDALAKLKLKHSSIIDRRKKDREAHSKEKEANSSSHQSKPVSQPAPVPVPVEKIAKNSKAELDAAFTKSKKPAANDVMPSVAEWLLWGDDDSVANNKPKKETRRSPAPRSPRVQTSPNGAPQVSESRLARAVSPQIAESHTFDESMVDSHIYSEFTNDDYTVDTFGDVTLASSKEPGLLVHGLMAVGELFGGAPVTPSPDRRRRRARSYSHRRVSHFDDDSAADESSQHFSQYAQDDSVLKSSQEPLSREESITTATTASSSPSHLNEENEPVAPLTSRFGRRQTSVKIHKAFRTSIDVVESTDCAVEMSLETITRMEI